MIGHPQYVDTNAALVALLERRRPAIAVHRGSGRGSIAENTAKGIRAAEVEGADIVEIDIVSSTDGEFFLFHDGYEPMAFRIAENITTLSSAQIDELNYGWCIEQPGAYPVERLLDVLEAFPGTFFNVDRSWRWWPRLLDVMAEHGNVGHLLVKSPIVPDAVAALSAHPAPFPYIPIVRTPEEVEAVIADEGLNTVGFELLAQTADDPFCDVAYLSALRERGFALLLNALNLGNRVPLYAGFDDETSMLVDPDAGWGELVRRGAGIIQTDWPGPLKAYLESFEPMGALA